MTVCKRSLWLITLAVGSVAGAVLPAQPGSGHHSMLARHVTAATPARKTARAVAARNDGAPGMHIPAVSHGAASIGGASSGRSRASMQGAAAIDGARNRRIRPR